MNEFNYAWHRGYTAGEQGRREEENPYARREGPQSLDKAELWESGRVAGEEQFLRDAREAEMNGSLDWVFTLVTGLSAVVMATAICCLLYWAFG